MYPVIARPQAVAIRVPGTGADTATVESPPLRPFGNGRHEWRPYGRICNPSGYSYCLFPIAYCLFPRPVIARRQAVAIRVPCILELHTFPQSCGRL